MNLLSESVEQRQLRILYRQFLFRIIDADLLSANADPEKLLGQIGTVLLSFSVIVSVPVIFAGPAHLPETIARTFEHFFLATTMLVVGLFAVLSWDAVFPARLDVLVLAPLPVRPRTIFLARMSAIAASLGVAVGALNAISGLLWPWIFSPPHSGLLGGLRSLIAYWITLLASSLRLRSNSHPAGNGVHAASSPALPARLGGSAGRGLLPAHQRLCARALARVAR